MSLRSFPMPLQGIFPPLATPLLEQEKLDEPGLERLVEHMLAGGVHGLFVLGTTGEAASLSHRLRRELIAQTCKLVGERVPVLIAVTDTSAAESLSLAQWAAECGAAAVVLSTPYYYHLSQAELQAYFLQMLAQLPLPTLLYNIPSQTKVSIGLEVLRNVLMHPNLVGVKDSSCDMIYFQHAHELMVARPDLSLLMGPEELLADAMFAGAQGGICGGANLFPRLYVELYQAAKAADMPRVQELRSLVFRVVALLYSAGQGGTKFLTGLKNALYCAGICSDLPALPLQRASRDVFEKLRPELETLGQELDLALANTASQAIPAPCLPR